MFETLLSVLGNPHFEAWVGGALSSLIINKLLQGANTARSEDRPHLPPSQRFQGSPQAPAKKRVRTRHSFRKTVIGNAWSIIE